MTSKYKGVHWSRKEQCFKSYVTINGSRFLCGIFVDEIKAAKARDMVILKHNLKNELQVLKPKK